MTTSNISYGDEVVLLEKGATAPFKGLLFSPKKSEDVYNEMESLNEKTKSLERIIALYKENEFLYDRKVNTLLDQNMKLSDTLLKTENSTDLQKVLWFGLGAIAVSLGMYAAKTTGN